MRSRLITACAAAVAFVILGGFIVGPDLRSALFAAKPETATSTAPSPPPVSHTPPVLTAPPGLAYHPVTVAVDGFYSWALLDRNNGQLSGSPNLTATNSTESMIKVWIVSDFLRNTVAAGKQPTPEQISWASTAIRDSNDKSAEQLFNLSGRTPVITRLIRICGLTDTAPFVAPGLSTVWWSYTRISARDAARMGACVADGRAAGNWTSWVLDKMAQVRGTTANADQHPTWGGGRWGIIDGLPRQILDHQQVSIKNGWTMIYADNNWHVNCLAITSTWILAVLTRYPRNHGLQYGADICKAITQQLLSPPAFSAKGNSSSPQLAPSS